MKLIYHVVGYIQLLTTIFTFLFVLLSVGKVLYLSTYGTWTMDNIVQWDDFWNYTRPFPLFFLFLFIAVSTHYILIPLDKHLKTKES